MQVACFSKSSSHMLVEFLLKSTILSITYAAKHMMQFMLSVSFSTCVLCPRIDPLRFLAGWHRMQLNEGLVVALDFLLTVDRACFHVIFWFQVHFLFSSLHSCYQYQCS